MNGFNRICACIVGLVLFVAGLLKLMDPLGASLVLQDYLSFFHLSFLRFASGFLGLTFALAEALTGAALIAGVWRRVTAIVSGILLAFFTILTFIILIANPAMDCGCFGQAIKLSHGGTFVKNLLLCALWSLAFLPLRDYGKAQRMKYVSFALAAVSLLLFTLYSCLSIPLMDFTSLKTGTELGADAAAEFYFYDAAGEYVEAEALEGKTVLISVYKPEGISARQADRLSAFARKASAAGFRPFVLVASAPGEIEGGLASPALLGISYFADKRMLMSLNRSNGGVTYLSDGQVIRKWSGSALPDQAALRQMQDSDPLEMMVRAKNKGNLQFQAFLLYVAAVLLLL